ncbi:hypothetical protein ABK040_011103 [Willaertia magna]
MKNTNGTIQQLPHEIKNLILSFLPICYILEILELSKNDLLNNNYFPLFSMKNINYFFQLQINLMIQSLKTINDISIFFENENEKIIFNKFLNKKMVNFFELKILSRIVMKLNYLLFLKEDSCGYNNNLNKVLKNIENNFIEICWIFNKDEIFTKNNTLQNSSNHLIVYNKIKNLITTNNLINNNNNLNSIFRIHGLLYLNNNELSFDVLNIVNLHQNENIEKKIIQVDQMKIINYKIKEILFQNIIKGNLNIFLQFKCDNKFFNQSLITVYNNYSIVNNFKTNFTKNNYLINTIKNWCSKINFKFYPLNKDEYKIKLYTSLFGTLLYMFNLDNIIFILLELIVFYFEYLFTFKATRNFIKNIEFHPKSFIIYNLFSIFIFYHLYKSNITINIFLITGIIFLIGLFSFTFNSFYYLPILEIANNILVSIVFYKFIKNFKASLFSNWNEGYFHLLFKRKLEFQMGNKIFKRKKKQRRWLLGKLVIVVIIVVVSGGSLISCGLFMFK